MKKCFFALYFLSSGMCAMQSDFKTQLIKAVEEINVKKVVDLLRKHENLKKISFKEFTESEKKQFELEETLQSVQNEIDHEQKKLHLARILRSAGTGVSILIGGISISLSHYFPEAVFPLSLTTGLGLGGAFIADTAYIMYEDHQKEKINPKILQLRQLNSEKNNLHIIQMLLGKEEQGIAIN